mgnify:CR=1 FL=1
MFFIRERIGEIIQQLKTRSYVMQCEINGWKGMEGHFPITDKVEMDTQSWPVIDPKELSGKSGAYFGICTEIKIPENMDGMAVELSVSTGREGEWDATNPQIAAYINGVLAQGMDVNHRELRLSQTAKAGEIYSVFLLVYTGESGGIYQWKSSLRGVNEPVYRFYYDLLVPWQCLELMEQDSEEYHDLIGILNETVNLLDFRTNEFLEKSVEKAAVYLKEKSAALPVSDLVVSCIGHTHIDVAWLWTYAVTQEKAARSFSTVLSLMDKYPQYQFMSSQAQLYKYVKQNQPELYERIKKRVKEGRWETEGGMFVEADCNLTSGESLVRQFLYGKKFFRDEFGQEHKILWLPDVFGYSAALPQIMKKCGIDSFMTTKISWNEFNKIPFDSFWWEGIDGTRILTHFITARDYSNNGKQIQTGNEHTTERTTNYNGVTHPSQIKGAWQRYQQKELNKNVLVSYGFGDGGGGSTDWMVETALRLQEGNYGTPKVKLEKAGEFFERLHRTACKKEFPVWAGELYLEYHRGTYTSMAEIKKANRKGEFSLGNTETWGTLARRYGDYEYPTDKLYEGWEILMRNQFHDVLPGSSIRQVYEDSRKQYQELDEIVRKNQDKAVQVLVELIAGAVQDVVVFNPNGIRQDGIAVLEEVPAGAEHIESLDGAISVPLQQDADGKFIFRVRNIPAKGWKTYRLASGRAEVSEQEFYCTEKETVTPFLRLKWNEKGQITSWYDRKAKRELLKDGACANVLMTYEDKPYQFDNWNIYDYYREKSWEVERLVSRKMIENGPVRMALELKWEYLHSQIREIFYFYPDSARVDIAAEIEWHENQILLKALFPLEINAREASYEIQYGNVKRSITRNTSWEQARFEVCFHKWLDLAEYDYGVSFLSDSKYGVSIYDSQVELTLLKSGNYPNPDADRGYHEFIYSVFPHEGDWRTAGTVREAYEVNNPVTATVRTMENIVHKRAELPSEYGAISISAENLVTEVLKRSEDGTADIIRFYECWNRRTTAEIVFADTWRKISLCNMLEEEVLVLGENTDRITMTVKPYEIVTLCLES